MILLLTALLPPVTVVASGRPVLAWVMFLAWLPSVLLTYGLAHPLFVLAAWRLLPRPRAVGSERLVPVPA